MPIFAKQVCVNKVTEWITYRCIACVCCYHWMFCSGDVRNEICPPLCEWKKKIIRKISPKFVTVTWLRSLFDASVLDIVSCDVWALMCDNVICSVLYTPLVLSGVCSPSYPQFTAAKGSPCPVQVVYLSALNFLHPPSLHLFLSPWLPPSFHCPLRLCALSSGFDLQSRLHPLTSCTPLFRLLPLLSLSKL